MWVEAVWKNKDPKQRFEHDGSSDEWDKFIYTCSLSNLTSLPSPSGTVVPQDQKKEISELVSKNEYLPTKLLYDTISSQLFGDGGVEAAASCPCTSLVVFDFLDLDLLVEALARPDPIHTATGSRQIEFVG